MTKRSSLHSLFTRQIARWTILGLIGSAGLAIILVVGFGVISTERQLKTTAESIVKAFHDQLLTDDIHQKELQIRDALHLATDESVIIRKPDFKQMYTLDAQSDQGIKNPSCSKPGKICWHIGKYQVSTLVPIYFNPVRKDLLGYLELNLSPQIDFVLLSLLFLAICAGSVIQGFGLGARLGGLAGMVGQQMMSWADHIKTDPKAPLGAEDVPFDELWPMQQALAGLNGEISRLEEEARDSAKLSIIRGISHDILSPVSQLQKYIRIWITLGKRGEMASQELISAVQRSVLRLTSIAQQTKVLRGDTAFEPVSTFDIAKETSLLVTDLQKDSEIESRSIALSMENQDAQVFAEISPDDYLRIADNLVRNAAHFSNNSGKIEVITWTDQGTPVLIVKDQGSGIPREIQSKIFDLNFTTRPGLGTGLGLAIVKQLCERNQAKISFKSEVGLGTEFRVEFKPAQTFSETAV